LEGKKSDTVSHFLFSEVKVVGSNVGNLDELTDDGAEAKEFLALLVADGPEIIGGCGSGGDLGNELLSGGDLLDVGEPGDVEGTVHVPVREPPAVSTDEPDAAGPVEKDHPSVDDSSEGFKDNAVDPAPDSEGQMGDVDDPDENTSAEFAVPSEQKPEDPVKNVVDEGDREEKGLPWEGQDQHNVPLEESCQDLEGDHNPQGKSPFFLFFSHDRVGLA